MYNKYLKMCLILTTSTVIWTWEASLTFDLSHLKSYRLLISNPLLDHVGLPPVLVLFDHLVCWMDISCFIV